MTPEDFVQMFEVLCRRLRDVERGVWLAELAANTPAERKRAWRIIRRRASMAPDRAKYIKLADVLAALMSAREDITSATKAKPASPPPDYEQLKKELRADVEQWDHPLARALLGDQKQDADDGERDDVPF